MSVPRIEPTASKVQSFEDRIEDYMERVRLKVAQRHGRPYLSQSRTGRSMYGLGLPLLFAAGGNALPYLANGWAQPDPDSCWTEGYTAELRLPLLQPVGDIVVSIEAHPHLCAEVRAQNVILGWNGISVGEWTIDRFGTYRTLVLSATAELTETCVLTLHTPDAFSPASKNISADPRVLGLAMVSAVLQPAAGCGFCP